MQILVACTHKNSHGHTRHSRGGGRYLRLGGTDDGACVSTHTQGDLGRAPPERIFRLGALRLLLRPYLELMPLEYRAVCFWSATRHVT